MGAYERLRQGYSRLGGPAKATLHAGAFLGAALLAYVSYTDGLESIANEKVMPAIIEGAFTIGFSGGALLNLCMASYYLLNKPE